MLSTRVGVALALALVACDDPAAPPTPPPPPPPPSTNPIDVAVWPRMIAGGFTDVTTASTDELCRRMGLDLLGLTPSADEVAAACVGTSPAEMARAFMATPRFRTTERRFWIQRVGADPTAMMGELILDADRLHDQLADGTLGYDDYAAALLAHPVMTIHRPVAAKDNLAPTVGNVFRVFLGRTPSLDEIGDYGNLLRPWRRMWEDRYAKNYGYYVHPAALDPFACTDAVLGAAACTSTLLGPPTTMAPVVSPQAPAGFPTNDRLFYYELITGQVPTPLQSELEKPGRLLATRAEFWDEAADLALRRFLGWWRSTLAEPDTVLPEVQRALAVWFRAQPDHDLRELYVTVMSSLLYTQAHETAVDAGERPPWATGPSKTLEPEQLLDSVERALGRELGLCDPHTDEPVPYNWYWPARLRTPQPADWYGWGRDLYRETAVEMGGCLGARSAPRQPGLKAMFTHIELADRLCKAPSRLLPPGLDPTDATPAGAERLADHLFTAFLARRPTVDEQDALRASGAACFADPSCKDASGLARETCGALLRSAAFLYY